mmetsp:Transcript_987/g.2176  ORF Transcript_987/g.2176 Transcript_987/m.2176 type:complete len:310 (+) Transcript_987:209-1138(+)|eukprot:CAMPEP_0172539980 /NCGR_PEP_ID=MMETSP1067-20121228/11075_1 /TAXON_ID=265564 ORGANISM="Thalassiosira punctigera, Strain Tpunct2005C2" /NCGR_SAMPLE_ID=MMETSP1067 /ASSEMBLY_ACC=CAM_ASM_000444 /LENGTH=309 /DNA_ID=CAMNT_0013325751 /DNA_START=163 /DNA_END=1092 /DNA_ORIENTATION=-
MKRPVAVVGIFLTSCSLGIHGRSFCFIASYTSNPVRSVCQRSDPSTISISLGFRESDAHAKNRPLVCHMNKSKIPNNFFGGQDEKEKNEQEQSSKRGVFKRMREKIATTFSGNKKGDVGKGGGEAEYKPNPFDAIRLKLAMAMSNINLFPKKEEWVVACPKTRVGPGQIIPCVVNGLDIIIFASRDGQRLDAFANACPHLGSPFDLATIERKPVKDKGRTDDGTGDGCVDCIVCPVHRTAFEMQSGDVRGEWCPYPPVIGGVMGYMKPKSGLVKFAVRLRGKNVEVRIATSVANVGKGKEGADGVKGIK